MDIQNLIAELKKAHEDFHSIEKEQKEIQKKIIQEEIGLVLKFAELIYPFEKKKLIHGEQALLLYVFHSSGKTLISPETYLKHNGEVVYQVHDEAAYRSYRPDAVIVDGYNVINLDEFLEYVPFKEIYAFFKERPAVLYENADELVDKNISRKDFIKKIKNEF